MDTLLILLGVLGFGAIIISVHVFSGEAGTRGDDAGEFITFASLTERKERDRRSGLVVLFPLMINDAVVHEDRRLLADRRETRA